SIFLFITFFTSCNQEKVFKLQILESKDKVSSFIFQKLSLMDKDVQIKLDSIFRYSKTSQDSQFIESVIEDFEDIEAIIWTIEVIDLLCLISELENIPTEIADTIPIYKLESFYDVDNYHEKLQ